MAESDDSWGKLLFAVNISRASPLYVEYLKRGTNKDIGPKDIFEIGSK